MTALGAAITLALAALSLAAQTPQNPSPMTETLRAHKRIPQQEVAGRRIPLSLGSLLLPEKTSRSRAIPLVIHFHGAPWLAEWSVRRRSAKAAAIAIQIGSGSGVYSRAFSDAARFPELLAEAEKAAGVAFRPVVLTSFSAGYGAIREILKQPANALPIDGVLLMDSLHSGYTTGATPSPVDPAPLAPFLEFAQAAAAGRKRMLITHSEIFPGTYASTTETAGYLLAQLGLKSMPRLHWGPLGMQRIGGVQRGGLQVRSFAGNSAPDHIDQFHAMSVWLRWFRID